MNLCVPLNKHQVLSRLNNFSDFEALCKGGKNVAGTARFLSDILLVISKCDLIIEIMSQGGDTRNATSAVDQVSCFLAYKKEFMFMRSIT